MESTAEMNEQILNAMFALNEAEDNLDEIYRIGLETAVSLLNANRGCIFQRDEWIDNKWLIIKTANFDPNDAKLFTASSRFESIIKQENNEISVSPTFLGYPIKIEKWTNWVLYFEDENLDQIYKSNASLINQFFHQLSRYATKTNQANTFLELFNVWSNESRAHMSIISGYSTLLLEKEFGKLNEDQLDFTNNINQRINKLNDLTNHILSYAMLSQNLNFEEIYISDLLLTLKDWEEIIDQQEFLNSEKIHFDRFLFHQLISTFLQKASRCKIYSFYNQSKQVLAFDLYYEDISASSTKLTYRDWLHLPEKIFGRHSMSRQAMKSALNKMGGQLKISAEAGKGYTLTITLPIVMDEANE